MKKTFLLLAISFFLSTQAFAHVTNEETLYRDISSSKAAADILLLDMLGIISAESGSQDFRPKDPLKTAEFEEWMAVYPYEREEIPSGTGAAVTYELVNTVLFGGQLEPAEPEATMSREEFAHFTAAHAEEVIEGENLISRSGFTEGPAGEISAVSQTDTGYALKIGGESYPLGIHPRIVSEIVDPSVWEGMTAVKLLLGPELADGQSAAGEAQQQSAIQYAVIGKAETGKEREVLLEEDAVKAVVKPDLDEEDGKINGITVLALLIAAGLIYWINRKKRQDIQ